jgi:signal transduction histidine kinase
MQGRPQGMTGALADITELKHAEQSMATLAEASRLLAQSLDSEEILATVTRMVVPSFTDAVAIHLKDRETGEPHLAVFHAGNPELLAAAQKMQQEGTFRVAAPSRRVMQTGRAELHAKVTPEWLLEQDVDEPVVALIRRFGVSSTIHVPIVWMGTPSAVIVFAATGTRVYNMRDLVFAEELARRASIAMRNAELFQTATVERQRAEEAAAVRERLLAVVGHDLRNPLSSVSMAAEMLCSSKLETADARLANRIRSSTRRMKRMIESILDFARIRAGLGFDLQLESTDLRHICAGVIDELRLSRPNQEIALDVEADTVATCDPDRVAQVLSNIVGNAVQHGAEGGPIRVSVRDGGPGAVAIEVHNLGEPIPADAQASIFEAFRREPKSTGGRSTSIGLGLFIADQLVRAHGGTITVRSPDRGGTSFTVVLPRKPAGLGAGDGQPTPPQLH